MSIGHTIHDLQDIRNFIFAGRAVFTLVSKISKNRITYKLSGVQSSNNDVVFVRVKSNDNHWIYLGTIFNKKNFVLSRKSKITQEAPSAKGIMWLVKVIVEKRQELLDKIEFWHEGKCGKCGRKLTVPESIKLGLGPQCKGEVLYDSEHQR